MASSSGDSSTALTKSSLHRFPCNWVWVLCYDRRSVGESVLNKAPIWGLRPDFYYRRTVAGLLMWGALSDGRTGLSFTIAAGPCQCSHSLVWAPLDLRPYFTVSDLRLPILSPPTTRRVTVEVFDPASTRVFLATTNLVLVITSQLRPLRKDSTLLYSNCFHGNAFICEGITQ
jgi:hypothetical protein